MFKFGTTGIFDAEAIMRKFDHAAIQHAITTNPLAQDAMFGETVSVFICREHLKDNKDDSWVNKGITYHSIVVPYDLVITLSISEVTDLCTGMVIERLLEWAKRKRRKSVKIQVQNS